MVQGDYAAVNWRYFPTTSGLPAELAANIWLNVTHFSAEDSLAASFGPSPLEQKPLTPSLPAERRGAPNPPPGHLPSEAPVAKAQAAVAGVARIPTRPANGRLSWVWNNSRSATVDRKLNISIPGCGEVEGGKITTG